MESTNQRDGSFGLLWSVFTELLFTTTYCHHTNSQTIAREKHSGRKNRPFGLHATLFIFRVAWNLHK